MRRGRVDRQTPVALVVEFDRPKDREMRLFVTPGCDACERARETLRAEGAVFETIDLSAEPHRRPAGTTCTPVLEIDGRVRFRGEVNRTLLRRLLAARAPLSTEPVAE